MRRGVDKREGMALLTVLLLVAVMSVVAVAVLDDVRFSVRRATNAETQAQAQWYAAGAESLARSQLADLVDLQQTPVVFLTGHLQPERLQELRQLGVRQVLGKPFDPLQLATQLRQIWEAEHG